MTKSIFKLTLITVLLSFVVIGCQKKWDTPPVKTIPETSIITIEQLKAFYNDTTGAHRFVEGIANDELSVYATVTMDETSGNVYKNVFVQDETGGLQLRLLSSGSLYQGDLVRIYLPGTSISTYQGMFQLDSVDTDRNVIKQETGQDINPEVVSIKMIIDSLKKYEGRLIQLSGAEFQLCSGTDTYADKVNQQSIDRAILDCFGNNIIARTSGYADFAGDLIPTGNGSLVAVVGNYRDTPQLILRSVEEVLLTGLRCNGGTGDCTQPKTTISQQFDNVVDGEGVCQECWSNIAVKGGRYWEGTYDDFAWSGTNVIEASGYNSTDAELEIWMITPPVVFGSNDKLTFESALAYTWEHNAISAWISTDFNGSSVTGANWTQINASMAGQGSSGVVGSGNIYIQDELGANYSGNYYIGFKYEGSPLANQTTTYRIDNIQITK